MLSLKPMTRLTISPAEEVTGEYISITSSNDADTQIVRTGKPASNARQTGNGDALNAEDGNMIGDLYLEFNVDNSAMFNGQPTTSILLEIEYADQGTDSFTVEYDGMSGGPNEDGTFSESRPVYKTNTQQFKTVFLMLKDVSFADRNSGADFRISDQADGAEAIRSITITLLPMPNIINVDTCGADPSDMQPDSDAIQACINKAVNGDIVAFTSGENSNGYQGYLIDKTIFLNTVTARKYLTFTSTDPQNKALLKATADLKGFVVRIYQRDVQEPLGAIDFLTISNLHLDGNRDERVAFGRDGIANGKDDNWGSYLPGACTNPGDPWCLPGTIALDGGLIAADPVQDYTVKPDAWSIGLVAGNLHITNTEAGTALGMGGAANVLYNNVIETAGDHVHITNCARTDLDNEAIGGWSDGITFTGPEHLILGNTIENPSDVGIAFFGGRETIVRDNLITATTGNFGAFAGIGMHAYTFGNLAYGQVIGNTIINEGDPTCGGIHAGIDLGPHMWGKGCVPDARPSAVGRGGCDTDPQPPAGALCPAGARCQEWVSIPEGATYTFEDNSVTGAQINFLVEGLDLEGTLLKDGNTSTTPQLTDWNVSRTGCFGVYWKAEGFVAHDPSIEGWKDLRIHCER